ncbi:MAG: hypothetical protein AAFY48_20775, partial [Bacteroidota bacterium]
TNFRYQVQQLAPNCYQYQIYQNDALLTFNELAHLWRSSSDFALWYSDLLSNAPFDAFFWEHPPLRANTLDRPYEFVLVESPTLARVVADPTPFRSFFGEALAVSFPNLRADAQLVAPRPTPEENFPHLASFCRRAKHDQLQAFWQTVGELFEHWVTPETRWLSTSGLGVYWLHVRWDLRPKYYTHTPYRNHS